MTPLSSRNRLGRVVCTPLFGSRRVERQVELQHIDVRFADDAEEAPLGVGIDQLPDLRLPGGRGPWRRAAPGTARRPG